MRTGASCPAAEGHDRDALWDLANYLHDSGHGSETLPLWSGLIDAFRATDDLPRLQGAWATRQ